MANEPETASPREIEGQPASPRELEAVVLPHVGSQRVLLSFPLPPRRSSRLTPAERAVLKELLGGASNAEIARRRQRSTSTIANQIAAIYQKLSVHSRLDAARVAAGLDESRQV